MSKSEGFATKAIHAGQPPNPIHGAVCPGIELSTTYAQAAPGEHKGFEYSRTGNPTRNTLETLLASIENGKYGICYASGSAATASITSILKTGDSILSIDDVYGGTNRYFRQIAEKVSNMKINFIDLACDKFIENIKNALINDNKVKMVWMESPTNPMLKVVDIKEICKVVHEFDKDIICCVDNTFATPYNVNPLDLGADIVVHSITKYLNGHSDIVMGVAITNSSSINDRLKFVQNSMGAIPSPFDCYMVIRGIKTLEIRMKQHASNAFEVAKYLEKHPKIERVYYPFLESHPNYKTCKKQMKTGGGMVTFLLKGGINESFAFLKSLKVFALAESLGAVESLAEHPAIMTHASVPKEQRIQLGILDNLVRLSVGIENIDDILIDLENALAAVPVSKAKL